QVEGVRSQVLNLETAVPPHLALQAEAPLVHVPARQMPVVSGDVGKSWSVRRPCGCRIREGQRRRRWQRCVGRGRAEWRVSVQKRKAVGLIWIVINAVSSANYRLVRKTVREAQPGRPVIMIREGELESRLRRIRGDQQRLRRV